MQIAVPTEMFGSGAGAGSNVDATSYTTASVAWEDNTLYILTVVNTRASLVGTPTVTGGGITWTQVLTTSQGGVRRTTTFRGRVTSGASTGALTIDFAGSTQTGCRWGCLKVPFADPSGTNGSGAIVQSDDNFASTVTSLNTDGMAALNANQRNAVVAGCAVGDNANPSAKAGFTIRAASNHTTPNLAIGSCYQLNATDNAPGFTWASASGTVHGVEIKAGPSSPLTLVGVGG